MKKTVPILLTLVIIIMVSCTPEPLDIHIPQAPNKIVMSSQYAFDSISNQSAFTVTLTRTLAVTTDRAPIIDSNGIQVDSSFFIRGAIVTLQTANASYELNEVEGGVYFTTGVEVRAGTPCKIEARDVNGNLLVQSSTIAMPNKKFDDILIRKNQGQYMLDYVLDDNKATSNWYVVNYFSREKKDSAGTYNDPKFIAKKLTEQKLDFDLFTDADFVGNKLAVTKKLPPSDFDTIAVAITEITQGYYDFLTVQKRYGKLINQLRGEALSFPTNVMGGLGYFNVNQPQLYILNTEQ